MVLKTPWMILAWFSSSWISCLLLGVVSMRRPVPCWSSSLISRPSRIRSCCSPPTPAQWT
uniref:Uncharacterized protein n=1 Tax=Cyprinus carpio TaxID=7962 RepID=A0A8C2L9D6_CYPCA